MSDRRSAVFLEEMGVVPQWRLRNRPVSDDIADAAFAAGPGAGPEQASPTPTPVQAEVTHAEPAASRPASAAAQYAPAGDEQVSGGQQPSTVPQRAAGNAQSPAAAAARAASAAPEAAGDAPQASTSPPAPAAPARVPGTPSIASTGEDMSWFDDAPTPEYKPQRKKVAAPEEPSTAPPAPPSRPSVPTRAGGMPQRAPAQSPTAASAPPSAMGDDLPAYNDIPMDEPPSWFDDDQPAAPAKAGASGRAAAPGQASDEQIAQMDWPALQAAISSCTRCGRCESRRQAIPGRGDEQATWVALDNAPGQAEDTDGYQFAGEPGYLLDNMLKAVGQTTEKGAYLTSLVKCYAPTAPSTEELQACRPYLQRELELTQAKVIVAFGHSAGKGLLGGAARGRIMLHGSVPVVATYHPADLLKKPEEKAKAWQDLCLAKAAHAGRR